jgi:hypothetical protein
MRLPGVHYDTRDPLSAICRPAVLDENGWANNPAMRPISRSIWTQGEYADIAKRQDMILRGEVPSQDLAAFSMKLQMDLLNQIARAQTSSNIPTRQDLEAPSFMTIPLDTPVRNMLPRSQGSGVASQWYATTSIGGGYGVNTTVPSGATSATQTFGSTDGMQPGMSLYFSLSNQYAIVSSITNSAVAVLTTSITTTTNDVVTMGPYAELGQNPIQVAFSETGAPASADVTYLEVTKNYKLLGTLGQITGFAMATGATFDNQLAEAKAAAIYRLMLGEEFILINGSSTSVLPPFGDGTNALCFDGMLNSISTANGTPGSHIQTAVGALTIAHIDQQMTRIHNDGGRGLYIICNAQETQSMVHLATGSGAVNRIVTTTAEITLGASVAAYMHPVTKELCPVITSRFCPAGTMIFGAKNGPTGQVAADVRVLPQVQLPQLAPNQPVQGFTAQELAPAVTSPQLYPFLVSVFEVFRMLNYYVFGKSSGLTPV